MYATTSSRIMRLDVWSAPHRVGDPQLYDVRAQGIQRQQSLLCGVQVWVARHYEGDEGTPASLVGRPQHDAHLSQLFVCKACCLQAACLFCCFSSAILPLTDAVSVDMAAAAQRQGLGWCNVLKGWQGQHACCRRCQD